MSTNVGSEHYVNILSFVDKEQYVDFLIDVFRFIHHCCETKTCLVASLCDHVLVGDAGLNLIIQIARLEPGCSVLLNHKTHAVIGVLSDDTDPMVSKRGLRTDNEARISLVKTAQTTSYLPSVCETKTSLVTSLSDHFVLFFCYIYFNLYLKTSLSGLGDEAGEGAAGDVRRRRRTRPADSGRGERRRGNPEDSGFKGRYDQ